MSPIHDPFARPPRKGIGIGEFGLSAVLGSFLFFAFISFYMSGVVMLGQWHDRVMPRGETARVGLSRMVTEIRETAPSRISMTPSSITFQVPSSLDPKGEIQWSDTITYMLGGNGNKQLLRTDAEGTRVIADDVQEVQFSANHPLLPTTVTIDLMLQRQTVRGLIYNELLSAEARVRAE